MGIGFDIIERTLIVTLDGEIDHHTCVQIRQEIDREYQKSRSRDLLLDFAKVTFMDSSGIGLLMGRYRNVAICNGTMGIYSVSKEVERVLNMAGICKLMKSYKNKTDAIKALPVLV